MMSTSVNTLQLVGIIRLILHGGENGGAATIAEDTERMSAGVVADDFTFALFGACTAP
jgi:hypothetical protein